MSGALLTISQLADAAGVTVRAVRHYHQRGLLPEPERDASGYRRYGAQAVLDVLRIKTLADAGVPLARIDELAGAGPERLAAAVEELDAELRAQIEELERRRRRIAGLPAGDRMFLAPELAAYLDDLHALDISAPMLQLERDGWILVIARYGQRALDWLAGKHRALADPLFRRITVEYDQATGWAPDDPRVEALADAIVAWHHAHPEVPEDGVGSAADLEDAAVLALVAARSDATSTPGVARVEELVAERLGAR